MTISENSAQIDYSENLLYLTVYIDVRRILKFNNRTALILPSESDTIESKRLMIREATLCCSSSISFFLSNFSLSASLMANMVRTTLKITILAANRMIALFFQSSVIFTPAAFHPSPNKSL